MRSLTQQMIHEYDEKNVRVTSWSTVNMMSKTYSVPSRLVGEQVIVRLYESYLEIWYSGVLQESITRIPGRAHQINYRHIIDCLLRKPGAFCNYRYHNDLFPTIVFRKAYDALCDKFPQRKADIAYLQILKCAAHTSESDVIEALEMLHELQETPTIQRLKDLMPQREVMIPEMKELDASLAPYDDLIGGGSHE